MSTALRVLIACLALFGAIMVVCMILGMLHWIVIGVLIVGALFVAAKAIEASKPKSLRVGDRKLQRELKRLAKDVDAIRKL